MAIETIVLAVGPSDREQTDALAEAATELAGPTGATVVLAHVFAEEEFDEARERLREGDESINELSANEVADRHASIRAIAERLDADGVEYEVRGAVGEDLGGLIVEIAEDVGADRLVVGGKRRSPAGKAVFGSTAQEVLLNAPCPVEYVRRD